ncbi:MAG: autotransporter domain-containing protein [Alphaproteobacteria bacterium]
MTSRMMGRRLRVQRPCVALSLLSLAGLPCNAVAATVTISTATTTPLQTATVDSGSAGDISIVAGGSIAPATAASPAITLNSPNAVTNAGTISFANLDNTIGIEVNPGSGSVTNSGAINIGPAASNAGTGVHITSYADNKFGILVDAGTFNGNIDNAAGGSITVNGDNSVAMDIRGAVTVASGNVGIGNEGTITVTGDHSVGIRISDHLTGNFISNNISVNGIGQLGDPLGPASAILIEAPITGVFESTGNISVSGYDHAPSTAASNDNATQMGQQSGPAVGIGSSITGGVYFKGPSVDELAAIAAGTEPAANETPLSSVTSLSSSNAVLISPSLAGTPAPITLGPVGTGSDDFDFINRGTISSNGEYGALTAGGSGVSAEAVRIQGAAGFQTLLPDGLRNDGTIAATAFSNFATGLAIGNLATVPVISNAGIIGASTTGSGTATAISIEPGASVTTIDNTGKIIATVSAATNADGTVSSPTGKAVAIDLSAASNDITVTNDLPPAPLSGGVIQGDVLLGSGNDTFAMHAGTITGNIVFGAGNDSLLATGGIIEGNLDFGAGAGDALSIDGGAFVQGALAESGTLAISVNNGTLSITSANAVPVSTAHFGAQSVLGVAVDTTSDTSTELVSSGMVTFDAGAKITPIISGSFGQSVSRAIVTAPTSQLQITDISSLLSANVPFVYNAALDVTSNGTLDSLNLTLTRKTTQELGVPASLDPALEAMLAALPRDPNLFNQFAQVSTQAGFSSAFEQLIPSYTDAFLAMAKQSTMTATRQIRERLENALSEHRAGGAWVSESIYTLNRDLAGGTRGYDAQGTVLGIGLDDYITRGVLAGIEFGLDHASSQEDGDNDSPVAVTRWMGGAYIGARRGNLVLSGSVLGAFSNTDAKRTIIIGTETRNTSASWSGNRYSADFAATYLEKRGRLSITPTVGIDYLHVSDDGYTETGGTDPTVASPGNSVALQVGARSADAAIAFGQVVIGYELLGQQIIVPYEPGQPYVLRPEIKVGFMKDLISSPIQTKARYVGDTNYFTIPSDPRDTQSFNAGVGFNFETAYGTIGLDGEGVFGDHTTSFIGKLNATFRF